MTNDYTLPHIDADPRYFSLMALVKAREYGHACAEAGRAPLLARIAELEKEISANDLDRHAELTRRLLLRATKINRLRAEVEALRAVLVRARRGLAWASQQRPELIEDYEAVDAAIDARKGEGSEGQT